LTVLVSGRGWRPYFRPPPAASLGTSAVLTRQEALGTAAVPKFRRQIWMAEQLVLQPLPELLLGDPPSPRIRTLGVNRSSPRVGRELAFRRPILAFAVAPKLPSSPPRPWRSLRVQTPLTQPE